MPTHVIDLSPERLQIRNIDPAQEGAANLLAALIKGPQQRLALERQRQNDAENQGRELWQMHQADDRFSREGQWHDEATKAAADERTYQHGRNDTEDARRTMNDWLAADYRKQALQAKGAKGHGPQVGDIAPSHVVNGLTTELVQVPKVDLFGDPVKGPDGKPVMTYARQPSKDAEKKLRAAGIDPKTLRYADPASLQEAPQLDYPLEAPTEGDLQDFHSWARSAGGPDAPAPAAPAAPAAAPSMLDQISSWIAKPGQVGTPRTEQPAISPDELAGAVAEDKAAKATKAARPVMPKAVLLQKAQKANLAPELAAQHYQQLGYQIGD